MNTYGKPVYQWNAFYDLILEVRRETGHMHDILQVNDGLEEIYKSSKTRSEFKRRMKEKYGW